MSAVWNLDYDRIKEGCDMVYIARKVGSEEKEMNEDCAKCGECRDLACGDCCICGKNFALVHEKLPDDEKITEGTHQYRYNSSDKWKYLSGHDHTTVGYWHTKGYDIRHAPHALDGKIKIMPGNFEYRDMTSHGPWERLKSSQTVGYWQKMGYDVRRIEKPQLTTEENETMAETDKTNEVETTEETVEPAANPLISGLAAGAMARGADELWAKTIQPALESGKIPVEAMRDLMMIALLYVGGKELEARKLAPKVQSILRGALQGKAAVAAYQHSGTLMDVAKTAIVGATTAAVNADSEVVQEMANIGQAVAKGAKTL